MSAFDVRDLLKTAAATHALDQAGAPTRRSALGAALEDTGGLPAEAMVAARPVPLLSPVVLTGGIRVLESLLTVAAGVGAHAWLIAELIPFNVAYLAATLGLAATTCAAFQTIGAYGIGALRDLFGTALRLTAAWSLVFLIVATAMFFAKVGDHYSRLWLATTYATGLGALLIERWVVATLVGAQAQAGRYDRRTAIVGGGETAETLIRALEAQEGSGIRIVGVFDDRNDERTSDVVGGYPKLGTVDDLVAFARRAPLDLIVFTLPISAETRILQMLTKLWVLPIDIRLSAHAAKLRLRPRAYSYLGSVPVLDVFDKPIADWDIVLKSLFDRVIGAFLLVALLPLMAGIALAVRVSSPGPVLFRQKRYGFNNDLIEVFKFRSMYVDQSDAGAAKLVTRDDPRVTPVGRILRKTSLDELPQLLNVVLKGNLSLVGPRPHALQAKAANHLYDQVVDGYFARHKVKPGITGWAQVNGWRGETDTSEKIQRRVEHDLYYIENWSVLLDLRILAATPFALLKTDSAY